MCVSPAAPVPLSLLQHTMQRTLRYLVFRCSMRRIGTCTFKLAIEYLVGILSHLLHTQTHTHTDTHTHRHTHAQRHTDTHTHMDKQFCMTTRAFTSPPSPKCNAWPGAVDGLHIHGDWRFPNNDGIDPDSSTDVEIRHTRIDVADDGICPKVRVVCSLVCFEVYVCDCVRVCMWGGMRKKLTHTRTHARMHARTHTHTRTHLVMALQLLLEVWVPPANQHRCRARESWRAEVRAWGRRWRRAWPAVNAQTVKRSLAPRRSADAWCWVVIAAGAGHERGVAAALLLATADALGNRGVLCRVAVVNGDSNVGLHLCTA